MPVSGKPKFVSFFRVMTSPHPSEARRSATPALLVLIQHENFVYHVYAQQSMDLLA